MSLAPKSAMKRKREAKFAGAADPDAPAATRPKTKALASKPASLLKKPMARPSSSSVVKSPKATKGKPVEAPQTESIPTAPKSNIAAGSAIVLGDAQVSLQIVAGSYDRTLHGVVATLGQASAKFTDTFLFNAHSSAIRCLALSPPSVPVPGQGQKIMLATGSTDERVNIYNLSAHAPAKLDADVSDLEQAIIASVTSRPVMPIAENAKNRELGTLLNHSSSITKLSFPTRSKLLSASEDSTIAVTRTRDWSLLSTIKAPIPKEGMGGGLRRPSGDTAPPGCAPSGVNDFAVHPSMKVMISVSRGERSMRLWNLVTGKKAGVLNFGKDLLRDIGEGRFATGEGRQVVWGRTFNKNGGGIADDATEEYAIGFDRNVVVFGMDSLPRCKVIADARTKTHDFCYLEVEDDSEAADQDKTGVFSLLAVATEDGRILLCSTHPEDLVAATVPVTGATTDGQKSTMAPLPTARLIGQLGGGASGGAAGPNGRVKAFKILPVLESVSGDAKRLQRAWFTVTASSTGALCVWKITGKELRSAWKSSSAVSASGSTTATTASMLLGTLLGTYQTRDRITCVEAFVMLPRPEGLEDSDVEEEEEDSVSEDDA
ncbi:Protein mak11 [Sporothrix epigloea]|uniref:Protein mak11 n=1 Tax=Sporothrix epigloea TaxID=1892477 RepID=A0ABP0DKB0_9PEZI